ncbi:hypothetical protein ABDK56_05220 [Sphingomonas sp. ASV193]|uniref:hypothetical protein n=1 Tax=Sphingomonas sp. ASV193 TaxID=3144405 RepID=UPI0032E8C848
MDLNLIYMRHFFARRAVCRARDVAERALHQVEAERLGSIIAHAKVRGTPCAAV